MECPICYEDKHNIKELDCDHEICTDCILKWVAKRNTCPICRDGIGMHIIYSCVLNEGLNLIMYAGVPYVLETKFVEMQIGVPLSRYGLVIDTRGSNVQVLTGVYRLCL